MKRLLVYLITTVGMMALVVSAASARMGGGGGTPIQQGGGHWGGDHGGGFHDGGHFDHDRFHDRFDFFFVGDFPFWYPYYYYPPYYYYDYPPYYYYDDYYGPRYYYDSAPSVSYYNSQAPVYRVDGTRSYLVLGHDSGKGLRKKAVTWNWFVDYLRAYIANAPSWARDEFHRGFIDGYGGDAESIYKKGLQQARQPSVSSNRDAPPSGPNPNSQQY